MTAPDSTRLPWAILDADRGDSFARIVCDAEGKYVGAFHSPALALRALHAVNAIGPTEAELGEVRGELEANFRCTRCGAALAHRGRDSACPHCHPEAVAEWQDELEAPPPAMVDPCSCEESLALRKKLAEARALLERWETLHDGGAVRLARITLDTQAWLGR